MTELLQNEIKLIEHLEENVEKLDNRCFKPVRDVFKPLAKVRYESKQNHLVIAKGSIIRLPKEVFLDHSQYRYIRYVRHDILKDIGDREFKVIGKISSKSPNILATYISGEITDGWLFFEGIRDVEDLLTPKELI